MQQGKWSNIKLFKLFFLYTKDIDVLLRLNKPTVFQIHKNNNIQVIFCNYTYSTMYSHFKLKHFTEQKYRHSSSGSCTSLCL